MAVEAKRVNGKGPSLAGDYVRKGVLRFVNGKYGSGHDYGIVIAYVAVPPVSNAVDKVRVTMNKLKPLTNQLSEFVAATELCKHPFTHKSKHSQQGSPIPITLVHLFIDFS